MVTHYTRLGCLPLEGRVIIHLFFFIVRPDSIVSTVPLVAIFYRKKKAGQVVWRKLCAVIVMLGYVMVDWLCCVLW